MMGEADPWKNWFMWERPVVDTLDVTDFTVASQQTGRISADTASDAKLELR